MKQKPITPLPKSEEWYAQKLADLEARRAFWRDKVPNFLTTAFIVFLCAFAVAFVSCAVFSACRYSVNRNIDRRAEDIVDKKLDAIQAKALWSYQYRIYNITNIYNVTNVIQQDVKGSYFTPTNMILMEETYPLTNYWYVYPNVVITNNLIQLLQ